MGRAPVGHGAHARAICAPCPRTKCMPASSYVCWHSRRGPARTQVDWEAEEKKGFWTRLWRAKWNLIARGPIWLPEVIRLTWYLQVISVVVGLHQGIDNTLFQPFFWARTSCCGASGTPKELAASYDVHYPDTMIYCTSAISQPFPIATDARPVAGRHRRLAGGAPPAPRVASPPLGCPGLSAPRATCLPWPGSRI